MNTSIDELLSSYANEENKKIIILLTDGSGTYYNNMTQRAIDNDITIYTVGLGYGVNSSLLDSIATSTGGQFYQADGLDDGEEMGGVVKDYLLGQVVYKGFYPISLPDRKDSDGDGINDDEDEEPLIDRFFTEGYFDELEESISNWNYWTSPTSYLDEIFSKVRDDIINHGSDLYRLRKDDINTFNKFFENIDYLASKLGFTEEIHYFKMNLTNIVEPQLH